MIHFKIILKSIDNVVSFEQIGIVLLLLKNYSNG